MAGEAIWLVNTAVMAAPLVLAAMGGLLSERSGVMNIALEGKMLMAACTLALVGASTGNAVLALFSAIGVATLMSLGHYLLTQTYKIDHVVSGMALNALALGGAKFLSDKFGDPTKSVAFLPIEVYIGSALLLPVILGLWLAKTRAGLRLLAVGNSPEKCRQIGLNPLVVRFGALIGTGLCCGLSGAMIVTNAGQFGEYVTAGKGFIALAALILGGWRPIPTLIAAIGFGLIQAVQLQLQGVKLGAAEIPSEVWNGLPYLATLVALIVLGSKSRAPAGMGQP